MLATGYLLDSTSTGLYQAVATLYFVAYLGIPAVRIGAALAAANVCGLLVPMPVARLTERLGVPRVYVALLVLRGVGLAGYVVADDLWRYLVVTCFFTSASRAALPLLQVLVGQIEGEADRTRTMASLRTVNNVGLGAGFALAAGVQLLQSRPAYLALFTVAGLAFGAVATVTAVATRGLVDGAPARKARPGRTVYSDGRFLALAAANAVLLLHDSLLFILIPLWVVQRSGLPPTVSSILLLLNTVLTVLLQVYVSRFGKGVAGALRLLRWSVAALVAAGLLLGLADSGMRWVLVAMLAGAVALLTLGENLHSVAGWELSFLLSDPDRRAQYLSLFSLGYTVQLIIGPLLVTSVVLPLGLPGVLLVLALFVVAAAVTTAAARRPGPALP